jgi:alkyl hydroperoxide reductase subunit F
MWQSVLVVRSWTPWTLKTLLLYKTVGPQFAADMEKHVREYDVDIMNLQRVSKIVGADQTASGLVELENGAKVESKTVILSTGARWRK